MEALHVAGRSFKKGEDVEFHTFLSHAFARDPDLAEKMYYHFGGHVNRYLIQQWAEGLVVPASSVQERITRFVHDWSDVALLRPTGGS